MEINEIKKNLIKACEKGDANLFKSAFFSEKVILENGNKCDHFKYLKKMIATAHDKVEGDLYLKIRLPNQEDDFTEIFEFYSKKHLHSRLDIIINEKNQFIEFDVLPF